MGDWLPALASEVGARIVMAISEADAIALNENRNRLTGLKLLVPEQLQLEAVLTKTRTIDLAKGLGIAVPRTVQIGDLEEVDESLSSFSYPVVLKWSDPNGIAKKLARLKIPLLKTEYCGSFDELFESLSRYQPAGFYPLVQEYCAGFGLGQMFLLVDGEPKVFFQHRRIHEWPPEGGVSTTCVSLRSDAFPELRAQSIELLRALNWSGPAMVEYRYDPTEKRAVLMEVNGRFWGSLPLASQAGALFAWNTYLTLGLGRDAEPTSVRAGLIARYMIPETRRLVRVLFQAKQIRDPFFKRTPFKDLVSYFLYFFHPRVRYYVFCVDDPMPFFRDMGSALRKLAWSSRSGNR